MSFGARLGAQVRLGSGPGAVADYSGDFKQFDVDTIRHLVMKPAAPGSPNREQMPGAGEAFVNCVFATNEGESSGAWRLLWNARSTPSAEVYFEYIAGPGSVSASNPKFTGYLKVSGISAGGPVGDLRAQSRTFPARSVSDPITSE